MGNIRKLNDDYEKVLAADLHGLEVKSSKNIFRWLGKLKLYAVPFRDALVVFEIFFPDHYPFKPPRFTVVSEAFHPNINEDGAVCMPLVDPEHWRPNQDIVLVMNEFCGLMNHPDPKHAFDSKATEYYKNDLQKFYYFVNKIMMPKRREPSDLYFEGIRAPLLYHPSSVRKYYNPRLASIVYNGVSFHDGKSNLKPIVLPYRIFITTRNRVLRLSDFFENIDPVLKVKKPPKSKDFFEENEDSLGEKLERAIRF